jgi:hypothetical protein
VAWRDALDLEILGSVACKLEYLGGQVFENGGKVDGGFGADARLLARDGSEVTLYATARELLRALNVSASCFWQLWQAGCAGSGRRRDAMLTYLKTGLG